MWILLAPRGFYDTFPTGPAEWVSPLPPFNEHLLRDFGAAGLGLAVLAVLAAVWLERRLVQATAIAFLVSALPHFVYHLTTTDRLSTADNLQSLDRPPAPGAGLARAAVGEPGAASALADHLRHQLLRVQRADEVAQRLTPASSSATTRSGPRPPGAR